MYSKIHRHVSVFVASLIFLLAMGSQLAEAQMKRERVHTERPVEDTFWAPTLIGMSSVENLSQNNLNVTIQHAFGIATNGAQDLFGLDGAANIRIGADYGITDRLSIGIGRTRYDKMFDARFKYNALQQLNNDRIPLDLAVKGDIGIATMQNGFNFDQRLNYLGSLMIARKFNDRLSLQVAPMISHFNTVYIEKIGGAIVEHENNHFAVGLGGRYKLSRRTALMVEYLPVFGQRSDKTVNAFSLGFNIQTGGHVFQLFFTSSQWFTEQHILARNKDEFWAGDFRFGFNVNRLFFLGGEE